MHFKHSAPIADDNLNILATGELKDLKLIPFPLNVKGIYLNM